MYATTGRYRLTFRTDPSNSIVIGWDQQSGSNPVVYYGTTDHGTNWSAYPLSKTPDRSVSYKGMDNTFARLTNLQPNTNYYFVIRDSDGTSARYWFKTCPNDPATRLSFIAGGDSRNNYTPRKNANKLVAKLKPHAVFFGGDMTSSGTDSQWKDWFDHWQLTIASDGRMFPIVAARGNHESSNDMIERLFDVPSSSVYYALTFGGSLIRTYTLNTETSISGSQTSWLVNDLQAATSTWKMAQYHKPMRPHVSSKSEGNSQYSSWATPFHTYGMNLVVECDAHTVKTTWPVRPSTSGGNDEGFIRDDNTGTVYVGEGCWGAPLRTNDDNKNWTRNSGKFNQFKWIFVDQNQVEVRTIKVDNADQVGQTTNANPFSIPSNLDIWNPSNGSVVTLTNNGTPPTCSLTAPSNGQYYATPQSVTLTANATDADGTVSSVEFYVNGISLGSDATAPYTLNWNIPANGTYAIKAVATDDVGNTTTSNTNTINVGAISNTISVRIAEGMDDVEQNGNNGSMYTTSSDIELVADGSRGNQTIGLRFQNLNIPSGATITQASIQFTVDETNTGSTNLTIKGEDVDNATAFTTSTNNVSNRTKTSATVNWSPSGWNATGQAGQDQATPNLKTIVQEIVDRSGWNAGNNMVFIITGSGERTAEAYEGSSSNAAQLKVSYTVGNTGGCSQVVIDDENFESGYGIWNDGGSDCSRSAYGSPYSNSGSYSIRLRDNSSSSRTYTDVIDLSSFQSVKVSFSFYCDDFDSSSEDFWLQISTNGGSSYSTVEEWNKNDEFDNHQRKFDEVTINGPFTSNVRFRFVCDATSNNDFLYIDDVEISGCSNSSSKSFVTNDNSIGSTAIDALDKEDLSDVKVYPNPFQEETIVQFEEAIGSGSLTIYNLKGEQVQAQNFENNTNQITLNTQSLAPGIYFLKIQVGTAVQVQKILKY